MSIFDTKEWKSCQSKLSRMYSSEGRFYHTIQHVEDCLAKLELVSHCDNREALKVAIWFHDAVYDPLRNDNESESARLADKWLSSSGAPQELRETVVRLIIATDHKTESTTDDEKLIVDIDLSILGGSANDYDRYAVNIRKEYAACSDDDYSNGRKKVLTRFLSRTAIYRTDYFHTRWEDAARKNITRELLSIGRCYH